jgi:hypothetical protein
MNGKYNFKRYHENPGVKSFQHFISPKLSFSVYITISVFEILTYVILFSLSHYMPVVAVFEPLNLG